MVWPGCGSLISYTCLTTNQKVACSSDAGGTTKTTVRQKINRTCSWNIRGGSMFANAGNAFAVVPTATN